MAKFVSENDVLNIIAQYSDATGVDTRHVLQDIVSDMKRLPSRSMVTGIPLWDFKNNFAPRELLWLRDQYDGRIVAKGWRRLKRFQNVTVTGCYPAVAVEKDGSSVYSVLVCWGNHEEILAAKANRRK